MEMYKRAAGKTLVSGCFLLSFPSEMDNLLEISCCGNLVPTAFGGRGKGGLFPARQKALGTGVVVVVAFSQPLGYECTRQYSDGKHTVEFCSDFAEHESDLWGFHRKESPLVLHTVIPYPRLRVTPVVGNCILELDITWCHVTQGTQDAGRQRLCADALLWCPALRPLWGCSACRTIFSWCSSCPENVLRFKHDKLFTGFRQIASLFDNTCALCGRCLATFARACAADTMILFSGSLNVSAADVVHPRRLAGRVWVRYAGAERPLVITWGLRLSGKGGGRGYVCRTCVMTTLLLRSESACIGATSNLAEHFRSEDFAGDDWGRSALTWRALKMRCTCSSMLWTVLAWWRSLGGALTILFDKFPALGDLAVRTSPGGKAVRDGGLAGRLSLVSARMSFCART